MVAADEEKCNHYSKDDYDDRDACVIPYIPTNKYWDPCFLCFCAFMFYSHNPYLPKANAACFSKVYPGVTDIYDPVADNPESLRNVHFWNPDEYWLCWEIKIFQF